MLTQTARYAMQTLRGADPALRESPNRDLGREANEARKNEPSVSAQVAQQRAQVAEQQRHEREAAQATQAAQRGEETQSPDQVASNRNRKQNNPQQRQNKAASLVTKAWQMILHHVPKKIMGLARALGAPVDYAEAVGAAKHGVDSRKEVASATKGHSPHVDPIKLKPDSTPQKGGTGKGAGLAA